MAGELLECVSREKPGICVSVLLLVLIWGMGSFNGVWWSVSVENCRWWPVELTENEIGGIWPLETRSCVTVVVTIRISEELKHQLVSLLRDQIYVSLGFNLSWASGWSCMPQLFATISSHHPQLWRYRCCLREEHTNIKEHTKNKSHRSCVFDYTAKQAPPLCWVFCFFEMPRKQRRMKLAW